MKVELSAGNIIGILFSIPLYYLGCMLLLSVGAMFWPLTLLIVIRYIVKDIQALSRSSSGNEVRE
jgi:hypothetical protein